MGGSNRELRRRMPRPLRIRTPDLVRHVFARGNGKMTIFLDDGDYRQFVYLLGQVTQDAHIHCWNYCLMPNHFHATLQPTRPNLSEALRRLNGVYGLWWNKKHGRVGHVFQGRFKDQIVEQEAYALTLSRYVVKNPVRARLVKHAEDWAWSSYRATAGNGGAPDFLQVGMTLELFGGGDTQSKRDRFIKFVTASEESAAVDRFRSGERIVGSKQFRDRILGSTDEK